MAGHSKFANIKHRKGAQDEKRAKIFTKLIREIITAAKISGPDPNGNPRLRVAISAARAQNLPKDRIDAAINKGSSNNDTDNFDEIRYEGYGPGGVAIIVEALTDNKNRTVSEVRSAFTKSGGTLGESGSVSFMFNRVGIIVYPKSVTSEDQMLEATIDSGANDCTMNDDMYQIICNPTELSSVRDYFLSKFGDPEMCQLTWQPINFIEVTEKEKAEKLIKLIDTLEDNDDVQFVVANSQIDENIINEID